MYERFSDQARSALRGAQEQARQLGHRQIGTEHLLLGVLALGQGTARSALDLLVIDPEPARQQVLARAGTGPGAPPGHIPFTRGCQKVLGYALNEAVRARHQYIGAEHILLALLRDRDGIAGQALRGLGADLDAARRYVAGLVAATGLPEGVIIEPRGPWRLGQRRGHPAKADGACGQMTESFAGRRVFPDAADRRGGLAFGDGRAEENDEKEQPCHRAPGPSGAGDQPGPDAGRSGRVRGDREPWHDGRA